MQGQEVLLPRGEEAIDDHPCDPDAENSASCAGTPLGLASLANKLCLSPAGRLARGSCTDPTWKSPDCPRYCTHMMGKGWDLVSCSNVTRSDTSYCCMGMKDCCDGGVGRQDIQPPPSLTWAMWDAENTQYDVVTPLSEEQASSSTPSSTSTLDASAAAEATGGISGDSTASPSTSRASTSTNTISSATEGLLPKQPSDTTDAANSRSPESTSLSTAAQAGIGVGAAAGTLLVAAVIYLWWRLNKAHKALAETKPWPAPAPSHPPPPASSQSYYYRQTSLPKYELQGEREIHEMEAQQYYVRGHPRSAELSGHPSSYNTVKSPVVTTRGMQQ
ncbi:hypothetical protein C7999DRAFT_40858 [Corynascus novoguineensis]|uniref:Uncharacterized protein n=1 Tax=Corynascus novoguineensis TaxID=1126955 RepID=A0AAN7CVW7_9PEZI|nr:hypothetical protein C7999DRAFT_40858 [Corynascus novoguineensis]